MQKLQELILHGFYVKKLHHDRERSDLEQLTLCMFLFIPAGIKSKLFKKFFHSQGRFNKSFSHRQI